MQGLLKLVCISIVVFGSCSKQTRIEQKNENLIHPVLVSDTNVGTKVIDERIAGSSYRKRATGYFIVVKSDTSRFMPIFSESKTDGRIWIDLNSPHSTKSVTYSQRLNELRHILKQASKEYNMDSLHTISIGRLIGSGDLAIVVTEEYKNKFGVNEEIATENYKEVTDFLLESTLTRDLNGLFEPYLMSVKRISIEKAFFTDKEELLNQSIISRDSSEIPQKVLDFMAWIELENKLSIRNQ